MGGRAGASFYVLILSQGGSPLARKPRDLAIFRVCRTGKIHRAADPRGILELHRRLREDQRSPALQELRAEPGRRGRDVRMKGRRGAPKSI